MNNYVIQDDSGTRITIGDWYVGIYLDDDGDLSLYIDHEHGEVVALHSDIADDTTQWAEQFSFIREEPPAISRFGRIRDSDSIHNIVTVEVTQ